MRSKNYLLFFCTTIVMLIVFKSNAQQLQSKTLTQINALLTEKRLRNPAEQKISSGLLQAIREKNNEFMAQGVQLKKAIVNTDNANNLKVDISGNITDDLLTKIQNLGGKIIYPSAEYHTLRALVNLDKVKTIAGFGEVKFIEPAVESKLVDNNITSLLKNKRNSKAEINLRRKLISYLQKTGINKFADKAAAPVTSEGDRAHRADDARNTYGYSGEGIKIGVLSDSYNATGGATLDVFNGDLPGKNNPFGDTTAVTVIADDENGNDEGRAMLHIIHDIAPKAKLFFSTADVSEADFANKIKLLRSTYHCDIIIDDVEYLDEPPFEDGMVAQAVNTVTADGALYFASAGNAGSVAKKTFAVYEGDFNDKGSPADTLGSKKGSLHNFGTQAAPVTGNTVLNAGSGSRYYLEWADPLGKSSNDYDLFLVDKNGAVVGSSTNIQSGLQNPLERISATVTAGDKLVIFKDSSAAKRALHLNAGFASGGAQGLTIGTNGQTFGHSAAANAFSVAATPATYPGPYPNAFDTTSKVEDFSSDGPRRIFYNADTTPVTSGNYLFSTGGGIVRNKPDVTAADGVSTQTSSTTFFDPFYGTSAAAPHAGAIAALLKSANPDLTPSQVRSLLTSTALDIEAKGIDVNSGYGILQAFQAMQKLNPTPYAVISFDTSYAVDGTGSNHNGFVEPGETGNLIVGLNNNSLKGATNVSAKISTSDTGITILTDSSFFGTVNTGGALVLNTAKPFTFKTSKSFVCGNTIHFTIKVTYSGGKSANKIYESAINTGNQPYRNISTTLGHPVANTSYITATGKQTGRLGRYLNMGSVCGTLITSPGVSAAAGNGKRTYDAYTFTNSTTISQCVEVALNTNNYDSLYSAAYNNSGFVPATPSLNFIAEPQLTSGPFIYSFDVAAGNKFTVVVHEVDSIKSGGRPYTLGVNLRTCTKGVLAVNLFNLAAQADLAKQQIPLHWTVANDEQTRYYEIQHSTDGINFSNMQTVTSVLSAAQKTYDYVDKAPAYGDNYYRIKKVDLTGVIAYSNIVKAALEFKNDIVLMPNPASAYINVISKTSISQLQVFNSKGQLLQTIKPQSNFYKLETGRLSAGQYFVRIQTNNSVINEKFIKQ